MNNNNLATPAIKYRVEPADPNAHLYRVTLNLASPATAGQVFSLPAWIPGSYLIRDFARNIIEINAVDSTGSVIKLTKLDKDRWQAAPATGALTLSYAVYAFDTSVRSAFLDNRRGFFNGTSLFLQPQGHEQSACTVELQPPSAGIDNWKVACGLNPEAINEQGFGRYIADNYQALIDHPVEMCDFDRADFVAANVPHSITLSGKHSADLPRLQRDLAVVCEQQVALFGEPPPFDQFLFMTQVTESDYGGLEHMNSTALVTARGDLPHVDDKKITDGYRQFLGLCSHEYFHCWNVKRIRPLAFAESDLSREAYSGLLWWFEGATSYYDDLALVRSGLIDVSSYLELLGKTITRVYRGAGRLKQSVYESSFDAWTRFYKQDANAANAIVSYYTKGSLVALGLDFTIRRLTDGEKCLDDLTRLLWETYGKTDEGVPEHGVQPLAESVAGESLDDFFQRHVYGCEDVPLAEMLADIGVALHWRSAESSDDAGGKPGAVASGRVRRAFGAKFNAAGKVLTVSNDSPAEQAGVAVGDQLVALNGMKADAGFDKQLQRAPLGSSVPLHVFRDSELLELSLAITEAPADTAWLELLDNKSASGAATAKRKAWLHSDKER